MPVGTEWQINFIKTGFARFNRQLSGSPRAGVACICSTLLITGFLAPRYWHATVDVPDVRCAAAGFRHAGECGVSDQLQRVRGQFSTQAGPFSRPAQRSHLWPWLLLCPPRRVSGRFASYQRTGHHAGFTANTLLLIDLNASSTWLIAPLGQLRAQGASSHGDRSRHYVAADV